MCVIFALEKGQELPYKEWENAVHNNEDGFGIVAKSDDDFFFLKEKINLDNEGEIQRLLDIVNSKKDYYRIVHLRNATVGDVSNINLQPFEMEFENRKVYLFHNGTFHSYKPSYNEKQDKSDTLRFVTEFVEPLLSVVSTNKGQGDYTNQFVSKILTDKWFSNGGTSNKGVLISDDDLSPLFFGIPWDKRKFSNDQEIMVSNTSYFDSVIRGSFFERRKKEKEEAERKERDVVARSGTGNNVVIWNGHKQFQQLKDVRIEEQLEMFSVDIGELFNQVGKFDPREIFETDDDIICLLGLSPEEIAYFTENYSDKAAMLLEHVLHSYSDLYEKVISLEARIEGNVHVG